ncbi:MAG: carotenoid biosynthesis protein [Ignavibacteriaceae bacterium]|jgi:putative membrane protein|nr:carotenoid biosynthesis protein [Ignavibacteriaceae bacterium]
MEGKKINIDGLEKIKKWVIPFFIIMYSVGIVGHLVEPTRSLMIMLTPFTLLLCSFVLFYSIHKEIDSQLFSWLISTYIITFILEAYGTASGSVFGSYKYGDVLGWKLFDVPLIIGVNWVIVILGGLSLSHLISKNLFISSLITGFVALLFDYILEPLAMKLDYWTWSGNIIPLQNYTAWFIIAFIFAIGFNLKKIKIKSKIPLYYIIIQSIFFLVLRIFL